MLFSTLYCITIVHLYNKIVQLYCITPISIYCTLVQYNCTTVLYYAYIWKSCACIPYYPAIISPCIYATISVIKICHIIFQKGGGRILPLADCPDKKGISKNQKSIKTIPFEHFRNTKSQETKGSLYPPNIKSSE